MKTQIVLLILFAILLSIFLLCLQFKTYLSTPGSLILSLILIYLLLKKLIKLIIYPGSSFIYQSSLESIHCINLCENLLTHINAIEDNINGLLDQSCNYTAYINCLSSLKEIDSIHNSLESLKTLNQANSYQVHLSQLLKSIQVSAQSLQIRENSSIFEEISQENQKIIKDLSKCRNFLQVFIKKNFFSYFLLLFRSKVLGNLDYMRMMLINTLDCSQEWVETESGKIDCLIIKSQSSKAVFLCSSNAGLYEFSFSQSEWLEYYLAQGVNIVLWNYRGFGRSSGSPDIKLIQNDGFRVISHFREKFGFKFIAVHGQSIGGAVACFLAHRCEADFLFADRTFSSLLEVALFKYGKLAFWLINFFCNDCSTVSDYLAAKCYKLISCDFKDEMIPDLASLKSGAALKFFYQNSSILRLNYLKPDTLAGLNRYFSLIDLKKVLLAVGFLYLNECKIDGIEKILNRLEEVQTGGKSLRDIVENLQIKNEKDLGKVRDSKKLDTALLETNVWICGLELWGGYSVGSENFACYLTLLDKISAVLGEIQEFGLNRKVDELEVLNEFLLKIEKVLEDKCGINDELDEFYMKNSEIDTSISGKLLSVSCGHNGNLTYSEKAGYFKHFQVFLQLQNHK